MVIFVPGTEETDPKKQNMSLQQIGAAASALQASNTTNTAAIAALQATGLPNTLNLGGTAFGELTYQYATSGSPATSGTTDANVASRFGVQSVALDFGVYGSGVAWFQNRLQANLASNLAIALNPNGGGVAVGKNSAATALDVNGTVTATAFSGQVAISSLTNSLSSDVVMNTNAFFDGPSVAQGSTGTWLAIGSVNVLDVSGVATINCRLHDGTTTAISVPGITTGANLPITVTLAGIFTSPAGNIRMSCQDANGVPAGRIKGSGQSNLNVIRIA